MLALLLLLFVFGVVVIGVCIPAAAAAAVAGAGAGESEVVQSDPSLATQLQHRQTHIQRKKTRNICVSHTHQASKAKQTDDQQTPHNITNRDKPREFIYVLSRTNSTTLLSPYETHCDASY